MTTIQASVFKARCLALMDDIARSGESLVITKNGKPVVELKPYQPPRAQTLLGLTATHGEILGDIIAPVALDWDALN